MAYSSSVLQRIRISNRMYTPSLNVSSSVTSFRIWGKISRQEHLREQFYTNFVFTTVLSPQLFN